MTLHSMRHTFPSLDTLLREGIQEGRWLNGTQDREAICLSSFIDRMIKMTDFTGFHVSRSRSMKKGSYCLWHVLQRLFRLFRGNFNFLWFRDLPQRDKIPICFLRPRHSRRIFQSVGIICYIAMRSCLYSSLGDTRFNKTKPVDWI